MLNQMSSHRAYDETYNYSIVIYMFTIMCCYNLVTLFTISLISKKLDYSNRNSNFFYLILIIVIVMQLILFLYFQRIMSFAHDQVLKKFNIITEISFIIIFILIILNILQRFFLRKKLSLIN
ncbi:MAG: hypothetical protein HPAVJP_1540 [Candidatus Hepatoplasma vulgare]|nr:MAG: hypothetical protein HPAVJP_1540 [Candidatus Hepatoplasma sp.]